MWLNYHIEAQGAIWSVKAFLAIAAYGAYSLFWIKSWGALATKLEIRVQALHSSTHDTALKIVDALIDGDVQMVLYLRSFSAEVTNADASSSHVLGPLDIVDAISTSFPRSFEEMLAEVAQEKSITCLAVRNHYDSQPSPCIPRLELPSVGWEEVVQALIERATAVVLYVGALTPGVSAELRWLFSSKRGRFLIVRSAALDSHAIDAKVPGASVYAVDESNVREQLGSFLDACKAGTNGSPPMFEHEDQAPSPAPFGRPLEGAWMSDANSDGHG